MAHAVLVRRIDAHRSSVLPGVVSVAFMPDGKRALSSGACANATDPPALRLWDLDRGTEVRSFATPVPLMGYPVAISADGKTAISGGTPARVRDVETGKCLGELAGHGPTACVTAVAFAPSGLAATATNEDGSIIVWKARDVSEVRRLKGLAAQLAFSANGRWLLASELGFGASTARLFDLESSDAKEAATLKGGGHAAGFSPDGRIAIVGGPGKKGVTVAAIDTEKKKPVKRPGFTGHAGYLGCVAFSADGQSALSGCSQTDFVARVWNIETGRETAALVDPTTKGASHDSGIKAAAFAPDGRHVLTGCESGGLALWRL